MNNIKIAILTLLLVLSYNYAQGQTSNEVYLEYLTRKQGISIRTGYDFGVNQKELKKKIFNSRRLFIRSSLGFLEMDRNHTHLSLNSFAGYRFFNQKTRISFEPFNLGLGYSYTRFKSTAFESVNGSFQSIDISDKNHFVTLHLQAFALGYSVPIKNLELKLRVAPEAIAYFSTQKIEGSDFGGSGRFPIISFVVPVSLNLKF
jgi:hypothetical protein